MTDPDIMDIVTMLRAPDRLEPHLCAAAADEIEQLRKDWKVFALIRSTSAMWRVTVTSSLALLPRSRRRRAR